MSEQRREERKKAMIFTPVYEKDTGVLLGYLGDLTLQGAMIVGERPIETGKTLLLAVEFREVSEVPARRMILQARTAWCREEDRKTYFNTGVEFLTLSDENRSVIETVIERYKFIGKMPG